ncbi:nitrate- and nitrite sensing domain-containing protein [Lipingzhangella sp. LS1_29]|uniref:histidine kinase n=1 Tax=Lipingzhangella rawalii TaxID=2055835 RepID=A0ABU2H9Y1_9ACTN|nr:nitrate- and nitrite sensing domain-containing protein [Lipingzhangella rawalii]MDS1271399.1 nitrate- and nitrite sensing domain-containing protein [Lipingzhangella rawalii]
MRDERETDAHHAKPRSIRAQLTRILLIPSLSFLVLWLVMSVATTVDAVRLMQSTLNGRDGAASFAEIGAELREERRATQVFLGQPTERNREELDDLRAQTDDTVARVRDQAWSLTQRGDPDTRRGATAFFEELSELDELRTDVDQEELSRPEALEHYTLLLESVHHMFDATSSALTEHESLAAGVLAVELLRARDQFAQADALLAGALAAGELTYAETAHFTYLTAAYRERLRMSEEKMPPQVHGSYERMVDSTAWQDVEELSGRVVMRDPGGRPRDADAQIPDWGADVDVTSEEWREVNEALASDFHEVAVGQAEIAIDSAWSAALRTLVVNIGGSVLALLAGVVAILVAVRSSRRLTKRLGDLRDRVLQQVEERLPGLVSRAQRGQRVDVATELPPLRTSSDELGELADAFSSAQRTAIGAAVKQAELSEGARRVFRSIAYRNQALLQRQLALLGEARAEEDDSEARARLFQLDHLATRGRRYADNLIILSGSGGARRARQPRPLPDVVRAAIAETEDLDRVRLCAAPDLRIRGPAVADLVHLLAELIENAAQFSPSTATVDVTAGTVVSGLTVEVEDRGLGMSGEEYATLNHTLATPPEFDVMALSEEPRLGLFVVARLADKHGIRVRLSASPYGGTRAVVLVPARLLTGTEDPEGGAACPSARSAPEADAPERPRSGQETTASG